MYIIITEFHLKMWKAWDTESFENFFQDFEKKWDTFNSKIPWFWMTNKLTKAQSREAFGILLHKYMA